MLVACTAKNSNLAVIVSVFNILSNVKYTNISKFDAAPYDTRVLLNSSALDLLMF